MNAHAPISPPYFSGLIVRTIRAALKKFSEDIDVYEHRQNHIFGAHQVIVRLDGQDYRLVLAPVDAPISIGGRLADEHFAGGIVA